MLKFCLFPGDGVSTLSREVVVRLANPRRGIRVLSSEETRAWRERAKKCILTVASPGIETVQSSRCF